MADITAEEAERLLEGTTPGPWRVHDAGFGHHGVASEEWNHANVVHAHSGPDGFGNGSSQVNARLLAAAPDLARTVISQAAEIERLREAWVSSVESRGAERVQLIKENRALRECVERLRDGWREDVGLVTDNKMQAVGHLELVWRWMGHSTSKPDEPMSPEQVAVPRSCPTRPEGGDNVTSRNAPGSATPVEEPLATPPGRCRRCRANARHAPNIGGEIVAGWDLLCCACVDRFMAICGSTVESSERVEGWAKWLATHEAECGPLPRPRRDERNEG